MSLSGELNSRLLVFTALLTIRVGITLAIQ